MSTKSPALLEQLRARLRAGNTLREAAAALGVSKGAVAGLLRRHGLGQPPPAIPEIAGSPRDGGCAWPTSNGSPWQFCDAPRQPGHSYCAEHVRRAFVKPGTRSDRPFVLWQP